MPAAFMSELWEDVHGQMPANSVCTIYTLIQVQEDIKKLKQRSKARRKKYNKFISLSLSFPFPLCVLLLFAIRQWIFNSIFNKYFEHRIQDLTLL